MNTTTRTSTAERLGRAFGRGWRAYARCERRASNWLVSSGACRRLEPPRSCGWLSWLRSGAAVHHLLAGPGDGVRHGGCLDGPQHRLGRGVA